MRICVIGHSSTSGFGLPDGRLAWPYLVAAELEPLVGEPVEVVNVPFVPVGSKAVPYALAKVEESQPDTVVVSLWRFHVRRGHGEGEHPAQVRRAGRDDLQVRRKALPKCDS